MPVLTLFVEFDGVLQPAGVQTRSLAYGQSLMDLIGSRIREIEIVLSDRRALHESVDVLRSQLQSEMATRVVSSVYLPELTGLAWSDYFSTLATRYDVIKLWLERERPWKSTGWLALEKGSQIDSWPPNEREHVVWGSLGDMKVQRAFAEKLARQLYRAREGNQR